jgi:hypothetical protein
MRLPALLVALLPSVALATTFPGGNLPANTTWTSADSPVQVLGDLTIPSGLTLTVQPGVTLVAATTDSTGSGIDTAHVELIVASGGTLLVQGSTANPVTITGAGGTGTWYGIRVLPGGNATLQNAVVDKGIYDVTPQDTTTLTNTTLQNASGYGMYLQAGNTSATGCTFTGGGSYDVDVVGGSLVMDHSLVTGSGVGVYVSAGTITMTHDTVVNNTTAGVYYFSSGNSTLRDSIVINNASNGVYANSSGVLSVDHDDVWGQSSNLSGVSTGVGMLSTNPLFLGSGSFKLTSNSPPRNASSDGTDMGAFAYAGDASPSLEGTLFTNTTLSGAQTVTGDLTVPPGVTLTLAAGATLNFATSDGMTSGIDPTHVELIVEGTLAVQGTSGQGVGLTSSGVGSWYGVRVLQGGTATFQNALVEKAIYDITAQDTTTLTNTTVQNASGYGLYLQSGTTTASGCTFTGGGSYDVDVVGGTLNADHSLIAGSGVGVYVSAGSVTMAHDTVVNNTTAGVYYFSSGNSTLRDSIVVNNASNGIYANSSGVLSVDHDDVWGQSSNLSGVSTGVGMLSTNPLFLGGGSFKLTSNSPPRNASSDGTDMGAFPYAGDATPSLEGTLFTNTTLSGAQTVTGDLTVPSGVTLTLAAGATLNFATSDGMASGIDTTHVELIVQGTLAAQGTAGQIVSLTSSGVGSWYGVRVLQGGNATLQNALVEKAIYDITAQDTTALTNTTVQNASGYGLYLQSGTTTASGCTFTGGGSYDVDVVGGTLNMDHSLVMGSGVGVYVSAGSMTMTHDDVVNNTTAGVYYFSSSNSTLRDSIVVNNASNGVYANSSGVLSVDHDDVWGQSSNLSGVSTGTGMLSTNPFFVSATDFHLTATSQCRNAASDGSDMGALPYQTGPLDHIVLSPSAATVTAGGQVGFGAQGYDASNNPIANVTFAWSATASAGTINATGLLNASCTPGTVTNGVTVTASGKSASANVTITVGPVASLNLSPGSAAVPAGSSKTFAVTPQDSCGNAVSGGTPTWSAAPNAGSITSAGVYTAPCTLGTYAGAVTVTEGTLSAQADVTVSAGTLAQAALQPQNPTVPAGGQQQFTAAGSDGCGNPVTGTFTWSILNGGGTISNAGLFTAGGTAGAFTNTIQASSNGVNAQTGVTVTAGTVAALSISPINVTLAQGAAQTFTATATDASGNVVQVTPTWSVAAGGGTIDTNGKFTAGTVAGTFANTVKVSAAGLNATATVVVKPGLADHIALTPATATLAPHGTTTFSATVYDSNNNVTADAVTWSVASAAAGTVTQGGVFTAGSAVGTYSNAISATAGAASATATVVVQAGALSQLTVSPASPSVRAGGTVAFSAAGQDANGNPVTVTPTWNVVHGGGTIAASGVFTSGTSPGTFVNTVQAQASGLAATATVIVTAGPVVQVTVSPSHPVLPRGGAQQFSAAAADSFGNPVQGAGIAWSADPSAGSITSGGLFTAGNASGDYPSAVTAQVSGISGTAAVQILSADGGFAVSDAGSTRDAGSGVDAGQQCTGGNCSGTTENSSCGCTSAAAVMPLAWALVLVVARRRRTA